jgi:urease accessory protein
MNGRLEIHTSRRNHQTILKSNFMSPPFKLADITEDKSSSMLELMMMSSSPGTLDNDKLNIDIRVEENCCVKLKTQSYQRIFNMQEGATLQTNIIIKQNGFFSYIPHPTVPHKNAMYTAINNIYLEKNSTLIWGEVLTCGRKLNNEVFLFSKLHSITQIFCENKLIVRENLLMQPSLIHLSSLGQLEGYTHQASLIFYKKDIDKTELKENIHRLLNDKKEINFGISNGSGHTVILRIMGNHAEELFEMMNAVGCVLENINNKNKSIAES